MAQEPEITPQTTEEPEEAPAEQGEEPVYAVPSRRPGAVGRAMESSRQLLESVSTPRLDAKTFLYGLVALLVIVLLATNWADARINLFGLYVTLPLPVWFVINLGLGALLLRLWQRYAPHDEPKS